MGQSLPPEHQIDARDWFLREWLAYRGMRQTDLSRATGIPKATMSAIFNGKTGYYRDLVNALAAALQVQPFELLMPPEEAMAIRRLLSTAREIAGTRAESPALDLHDGRG
jgi:transcriptional regulator with XRE-family HTH domain